MEFIINKNIMIMALQKVVGIGDKKTTLPILSHSLISIYDNKLNIKATNLEISFEGEYPCKVITPGSIAIQSRYLFDLIKEFDSNELNFKITDGYNLEVFGNESHFRLKGLSGDDFPSIQTIEEENYIEIDSEYLLDSINKIIFSTLDDETNSMSGVYFDPVNEKEDIAFKLVASDGHRVAVVGLKGEKLKINNKEKKDGVVIPKKGLIESRKILENKGIVKIGLEKNYFYIKKEKECLIISLLETKYPNYKIIFPETIKNNLKIEVNELYKILKRMSIYATDEYKSVLFDFENFENLKIKIKNPQKGDGEDLINIEYEGEQILVFYNIRYLLDVLNVINSDVLEISIKSEKDPCIIQGKDDPEYLYLIMPMLQK